MKIWKNHIVSHEIQMRNFFYELGDDRVMKNRYVPISAMRMNYVQQRKSNFGTFLCVKWFGCCDVYNQQLMNTAYELNKQRIIAQKKRAKKITFFLLQQICSAYSGVPKFIVTSENVTFVSSMSE